MNRPLGDPRHDAPLDLRVVARSVSWQAGVVLVVFGLVVGLAVLYSVLQPTVYRATARVQIPTEDPGVGGNARGDAETAAKIADSAAIAERVLPQIGGLDLRTLQQRTSATAVSDGVVAISGKGPDAEAARQVASLTATEFIAYTVETDRGRIDTQIAGYEEQAAIYTTQITEFDRQIADLAASLELLPQGSADRATQSALRDQLIGQRGSIDEQLSELNARLVDARLELQLTSESYQLVEDAQLPQKAISPTWSRNLLFAIPLGLLAAVVVAIAREQARPKARTRLDIARAVGAPVIGTVRTTRTGAGLPLGRSVLLLPSTIGPGSTVLMFAPLGDRGAGAVAEALAKGLAARGLMVQLVEAPAGRRRTANTVRISRSDLDELGAGGRTIEPSSLSQRGGSETVIVVHGIDPTMGTPLVPEPGLVTVFAVSSGSVSMDALAGIAEQVRAAGFDPLGVIAINPPGSDPTSGRYVPADPAAIPMVRPRWNDGAGVLSRPSSAPVGPAPRGELTSTTVVPSTSTSHLAVASSPISGAVGAGATLRAEWSDMTESFEASSPSAMAVEVIQPVGGSRPEGLPYAPDEPPSANDIAESLPHATLTVAVAAVLCAALGAYRVGDRSLWMDEAFSWSTADRSWGDLFHLIRGAEANGALYSLFLKPWIGLDEAEGWMRLPSVLFMAATVPLVYLIGRRLLDQRDAVLAAVLFAVNGSVIMFAQQVRGYALVSLLAALSWWCFVTDITDTRRTSNRPAWWWAILSVALAYGHVVATLIPVAQLVSLVWVDRPVERLRERVGPIALWIVGLVPLALSLRGNDEIQGLLSLRLGVFRDVLYTLTGRSGVAGVVMVGVLGAIGGFDLWRRALDGRGTVDGWRSGVVLTWVVVPPVLLLAVSLVQPLLIGRYLLICLPGIVLVVARGAWLAATAIGGLARWTVPALTVAVSLIGVTWWLERVVPEDWSQASRAVIVDGQSGDVVVFVNDSVRLFAEYYREQAGVPVPNAVPVFPDQPWGAYGTGDQRYVAPTEAELTAIAARSARVWFVVGRNHDNIGDVEAQYAVLERTHTPVRRTTYAGDVEVTLYELAGGGA